jgi:hypothetical protein
MPTLTLVAIRPKVSFWPDGSISPGNYGSYECVFLFVCMCVCMYVSVCACARARSSH